MICGKWERKENGGGVMRGFVLEVWEAAIFTEAESAKINSNTEGTSE